MDINGVDYILSGNRFYSSKYEKELFIMAAQTTKNNLIYSFHVLTSVEKSVNWLNNLLNDIDYK